MLRDCRAQGPGRAARGAFATHIPSRAYSMDAHRAPTRGQVRCCADVKPSASWPPRQSGCSVWGESNVGSWQCAYRKTFAEAEEICQAADARLCTSAELVLGCTVGTGCGFDVQLVWGTIS